jgi:hypothetical protein
VAMPVPSIRPIPAADSSSPLLPVSRCQKMCGPRSDCKEKAKGRRTGLRNIFGLLCGEISSDDDGLRCMLFLVSRTVMEGPFSGPGYEHPVREVFVRLGYPMQALAKNRERTAALCRDRDYRWSVVVTGGEHCPGVASQLVRGRGDHYADRGSRFQPVKPRAELGPFSLHAEYGRSRAMNEQLPQISVTPLLMPKSQALPPVGCCRGTSLSQEENSRPL